MNRPYTENTGSQPGIIEDSFQIDQYIDKNSLLSDQALAANGMNVDQALIEEYRQLLLSPDKCYIAIPRSPCVYTDVLS